MNRGGLEAAYAWRQTTRQEGMEVHVRRPGDLQAWRPGGMETQRHGSMIHRGMEVWRHRGMDVYTCMGTGDMGGMETRRQSHKTRLIWTWWE